MRTITAKEHRDTEMKVSQGYIWSDEGEGCLLPVRYYGDGWVCCGDYVSFTSSYRISDSGTVYIFDDDADREHGLNELQHQLKTKLAAQ